MQNQKSSQLGPEDVPLSHQRGVRKAKRENRHHGKRCLPPDGGWGWVVVLAGFISLGLSYMTAVLFGILFHPMLTAGNYSSTTTAWFFNTYNFVSFVTAFLTGPLCEVFGWRAVAVVGGLLNSVAMAMCAFAPNVGFLFFSYSTIAGIGSSIGNTVPILAVSKYFDKRRGLAMGLMNLGLCLGGFVSPLLTRFLLSEYGYMWAALICSAILLHQSVCGMFFHPVEWHQKFVSVNDEEKPAENGEKLHLQEQEEIHKRRTSDFRLSLTSTHSAEYLSRSESDADSLMNSADVTNEISGLKKEGSYQSVLTRLIKSIWQSIMMLKYFRMLIIAFGTGSIYFGIFNFTMWISFAVVDKGYSLSMAAWCVSSTSVGNVVGRFCMALAADRSWFNIKIAYVCGFFLVGLFITGFAVFTEYTYVLICSSLYGFSIGTVTCLHPLVLIEVMGFELFPSVYGVTILMVTVFVMTVGPLVGKVRDLTDRFGYALGIVALMFVLSGILWLMMPLAQARDKKKDAEKKRNSKGDIS